jgi:hypothetical protein
MRLRGKRFPVTQSVAILQGESLIVPTAMPSLILVGFLLNG